MQYEIRVLKGAYWRSVALVGTTKDDALAQFDAITIANGKRPHHLLRRDPAKPRRVLDVIAQYEPRNA